MIIRSRNGYWIAIALALFVLICCTQFASAENSNGTVASNATATVTISNNPSFTESPLETIPVAPTKEVTQNATPIQTINPGLTATNAGGSNTSIRTGLITVTNPGIASGADFTAAPLSGKMPLTVQFTDTSTTRPTGWAWFFGDERYNQPWTKQTASAGWAGRSGFAYNVLPDGSIVIMGGSNSTKTFNDVWRSTDKGVTWTKQTAKAGWSPRYGSTSVVLPDGSIVLMGGVYGVFSDVWRSADKGVTWTQQTTSAPYGARYNAQCVAMPDGSIVLIGGIYPNKKGIYDEVWRSTDKGVTWALMNASAIPVAREGFTSNVMPDGSIVLMGGVTAGSSPKVQNDVWRSTDEGATWTEMSSNSAWKGRYGAQSVAMPDGSIVLMGGTTYVSYFDVWRSIDEGATWTKINASIGGAARWIGGSVVLPDGSIVTMGGLNASSNQMNDVWRFQPAGSSLQDPSHTYRAPGNYNVTLMVTNGAVATTSAPKTITVLP